MNIMPLGSRALVGNPLNINCSLHAKGLGFAKLVYNSKNAIGSRDFISQNAVYFHCNIKKERKKKVRDNEL
jgi:argininosuccinate lyase